MRLRKTIIVLFSLLLVAAPFLNMMSVPVSAIEDPTVTDAKSAYLYNLDNDQCVYSLHADDPVYPCSTVKLMTGIVAYEQLKDRLDEKVTITYDMLTAVSGNNIGLAAGDTVIIGEMLGAMLVNGANDAAYVLAYLTAGSAKDFVQMMNEKAATIGANSTYYANPTGLHDNAMTTTARDTCTIALYAYNLSGFMDYDSQLKCTVEISGKSSSLYNRNCMLSLYYEQDYYYDKAVGMNAGSTYEGGYCVVTTASDGDLTYLAVVMDADTNDDGKIMSYINAKNMLEWAFESYMYIDVLSPNTAICEVPVSLSVGIDYVTLVSADTLNVYLPTDTDVESEITLSWTTEKEVLEAPIEKDQVVGRVTALYKGDPIGTSDLIATMDVERSDLLYSLNKIKLFTQSTFFIAAAIAAVVFGIAWVVGKSIYLKNKKNYRFK